MEEITIYRAEDGTDFDDEYECMEYEWKTNIGDNPEFRLLDGDYQELCPQIPMAYEKAEFVFIPNLRAAKKCYDAWDGDITGQTRPDFLDKAWRWDGNFECELGLWKWDWDREEWFHVGSRIRELQQYADKAMEVINGGV